MKDDQNQPEMGWLLRLGENDEKALALLMERYYNDLFSYAASFTHDRGMVKDCIQEVFISLWQRRETAGTILSPKYYLLRAVKNNILKSLHRSARLRTIIPLENEYEFCQEFAIDKIIIDNQLSEEKAVRLKKALTALSRRQQEIVHLKYYQHLDHGQIAELMNITTQSVYNLLHETIQKLREVWHSEFVSR